MQDYDYLTYYVLKSVVKNFDWVFVIGCLREQAFETAFEVGGHKKEMPQFEQGIQLLEHTFERNFHMVRVKPL